MEICPGWCHDPSWTDQGVVLNTEFPLAKLRPNGTKQSAKRFIHGKLNLGGISAGGRFLTTGTGMDLAQ